MLAIQQWRYLQPTRCCFQLKCAIRKHLRCYNTFQYCESSVRKRAHENYLALLLLPTEQRKMGMVAHAFNIELAQIQQQTTEVATAKGRIDFWRRALQDTYRGHPPAHPVMISLALCLEETYVQEKWFNRLLSIRKQHLNDLPFMTLNDAEEYGEYAVSSLLYILLDVIGNNEVSVEHTASHLGKACSLVTLVRSVPYFIQKRKVFLPMELCHHHQVSHDDIVRNKNTEATREVIYETASQAFVHLEHVTNALPGLPSNSRRIFLPSVSCGMFLEHMRKIDFDISNEKFDRKQWMLPFRLVTAALRMKM